MNKTEMSKPKSWQVNLERLIHILNEFTYASKDVAIRELISNAADSISERLQDDASFKNPEIHLRIVKDKLIIEDNGSGMKEDDLHSIFSTVASSSKNDLRKRFAGLDLSQPIIGTLGIGRLAAFLIADEIVVETKSWQPNSANLQWTGTAQSYQIAQMKDGEIGTCVHLTIKSDLREDFLAGGFIRKIVLNHSRNIFYPIYVGKEDRPVNESKAPWYGTDLMSQGYERAVRSYLTELSEDVTGFEDARKAITVIPLRTNDPVTVKGVLYVPNDVTFSLKNQGSVDLYSRGVLLCEDYPLVPREVAFVKGIVESPDLTPTVNRQGVVQDWSHSQVQNVIRQSVLTHLTDLAKSNDDTDSARFSYILAAHRRSIVRGAVHSSVEFFDTICQYVLFRCNVSAESPTNLSSYLRRSSANVVMFTEREFGEGHLEQFVQGKLGEVLILDDPVDKEFIRRYGNENGITVKPIPPLSELLADLYPPVEPSNTGWKRIRKYFEAELDHRELQVTVVLADLHRDNYTALVVPDSDKDQTSFIDLLSKDAETREQDPEKRRAIQNKLRELGGRRQVRLYVNIGSQPMQRLAMLIDEKTIEARQADTVLHEIFHSALVNANISIPPDHLSEVHNRALGELCGLMESYSETLVQPQASAEVSQDPRRGRKTVVAVDMSQFGRIAHMIEDLLSVDEVLKLNQDTQHLFRELAETVCAGNIPIILNTGDGALLIFNEPEESVRFGEALQAKAEKSNMGKNPEHQKHFRIGISRGEIIIQEERNADGALSGHSVAGAPIVKAVRLETECELGEIMIDDYTWARLSDDDQAAYSKTRQVEGKSHESWKIQARSRTIYQANDS